MKKASFFLLFFSIAWTSCYYNSEDELYGTAQCKSSGISFKNDVNPIISVNCVNCHFNGSTIGAGINLSGYNALLTYAKNNSLVGSIKHSGYSPMPKGQPKLSSCNIRMIETWVKEGSLNN